MDLRQLRYFVRIVECGTLTKAAASLYISQPSLGEHVRNLEAEFGVELLQRHSRGVRPTEAGLLLMQRAEHLLAYADETRQALLEFGQGASGAVTLGISPGLNELFSAELISRCQSTLPNVSINVVEDLSAILVDRLNLGPERINLALISGYDLGPEQDVTSIPIAVETLFLVGSPTVLQHTEEVIDFDELCHYPLVMLGSGAENRPHGLRRFVEQQAAARGLKLDITLEVSSVAAVRGLLERDFGASLLPLPTVRRRVEEGALHACAVINPPVNRVLNLVRASKHRATRAESAVRDALIQLVEESIDKSGGMLCGLDN